MPLSRVFSSSQIYTDAAYPGLATNTVINLPTPPGGIQAGDEEVIIISQFVSPINVDVQRPAGWVDFGHTPSEFGIGAAGSSIKVTRMWRNQADGTSQDSPSVKVNNPNTSSAQVKIHACFLLYRGGRLSFFASGSVGNDTIAPPSLPASIDVPKNSLIISAAYQTRTVSAPTMAVSNGFSLVYSANSSSTVSPLGLGASDLYLVKGTKDLPQWNVSRGNQPGEHHHCWSVLKVVEESGKGLVVGDRFGNSIF